MTEPISEDTKAAIAAEFNVPDEHRELLTAPDLDGLRAQAQKIGTLAAAIPPRFATNPGQGQGGSPLSAEDAEYLSYYPNSPRSRN